MLFAIALVMTVFSLIRHNGPRKAPGWVARPQYSGWFVTGIDRGGPADGRLEVGDRLLAINGDERAAVIGTSYWRHLPAEEMYRVDIERRGTRGSPELLLPRGSGRPIDLIFLIYSVVFFATGAATGLARPHDRQVRTIALCLTIMPRPFKEGFGTTTSIP